MSARIIAYVEDIDAHVAETDHGLIYLTACCQATATGGDGGIVCRRCYEQVHYRIGMPVEARHSGREK